MEGAQHGPELRPQQKYPQPHSSPSPRGAHSFQAEGGVGSVCVMDVPLAVVPGKESPGRLASKVPTQVPGPGEMAPGTACGALCGCCPSCLPRGWRPGWLQGHQHLSRWIHPGRWGRSPRTICRAVYNTPVTQEAWLAFSGLFVLLIFISVYFLNFKKKCVHITSTIGKRHKMKAVISSNSSPCDLGTTFIFQRLNMLV